ncbi:hypothetical protein K438DRAFT_2012414 [Mycena galopus ATCC 62051]|nr:hypothetical protein K438DRAFT_2012414 [Mycena galopus ATCC 62051]
MSTASVMHNKLAAHTISRNSRTMSPAVCGRKFRSNMASGSRALIFCSLPKVGSTASLTWLRRIIYIVSSRLSVDDTSSSLGMHATAAWTTLLRTLPPGTPGIPPHPPVQCLRVLDVAPTHRPLSPSLSAAWIWDAVLHPHTRVTVHVSSELFRALFVVYYTYT